MSEESEPEIDPNLLKTVETLLGMNECGKGSALCHNLRMIFRTIHGSPATGIEAEVCADKLAICRSLAFKASNYYDALFLRTGNTAADNMQELAQLFAEEWTKKYPNKP